MTRWLAGPLGLLLALGLAPAPGCVLPAQWDPDDDDTGDDDTGDDDTGDDDTGDDDTGDDDTGDDDGTPPDDADGDGYTVADGDCDDNDPAMTPEDADGDGYSTCVGDCDDADAAVSPGAVELCNGVDDDCDGTVDDGIGDDADGDGFSLCDHDCDDADPTVYPGATELCDGLDNDCNGTIPPLEADHDGDGYWACDGDCNDNDPAQHPGDDDGDGVSPCDGDCDDSDPATHPGAPEICDGADNDCDGALEVWEQDQDADGVPLCDGDCDDLDADSWPGAPELCDGVDNNCDGQVDEGFGGDADGDGYTVCQGDCDDADPAMHPGAQEQCNGLDDDCNGVMPWNEADDDADGDPACADCDDADPAMNSLDADGDLFSTCDGDCDDADPARSPGAPDAVGDGIDNNCDGIDGYDGDGDGWASVPTGGTDCDDADPLLNQDDADGDGFTSCDGDCWDFNDEVYPGSYEVPGDQIDNNCDGQVDELIECDCPSPGGSYAEALDMCYGVVSESSSGVTNQIGILDAYGSAIGPQYGCFLAALHTGYLFEAPAQYGADVGTSVSEWDFTGQGVDCAAPPPPGYETKNNLASITVQLEVPPNTNSFSIDFLFVSSEYIEWVCTDYNDTFEMYLESSALDPASYPDMDGDGVPEGNIAFDGNGKPITVNSNFFVVNDCSTMYYVPGFSGQGFGAAPGTQVPCTSPSGTTNDAGATGWLTTVAPVTPGETITLKFSIWDEGDGIYDSAVFVDDFQWDTTVVGDPSTS